MMFLDTLHPDTKKLFDRICDHSNVASYHLIGGTALAMYLGHRESVDLDFVHYDLLTPQIKRTFTSIFPTYEIVYESNEQLDLFVDTVKCTLMSYRRKPLFPLQKYHAVDIRDMRDIAISKASTIGRRSELKDYIDLYILLSQGYLTLSSLIELCQQKLQGDFSKKLFFKQLLLVEQCESYTIPILGDREVTIPIMNTYFQQLVSSFMGGVERM